MKVRPIDTKRRLLLATPFVIGAAALFSFYQKEKTPLTQLYAKETQVLLHLAYHLYPHSALGPGSVDLHISGYLHNVLSDTRIMQEDRDYFKKGAFWLEESSFEVYEQSFLNLSTEQKEELLKDVSKKQWARTLIYTCLSYIFEALLSAPVYGSNLGEIGWKWLEHNPGFPQPTTIEEIRYEV